MIAAPVSFRTRGKGEEMRCHMCYLSALQTLSAQFTKKCTAKRGF